jgi:hypothetical protein|tara:strand:- start:315 stop:533 length:219 start_codon:yes stop_codon:yes gene_type:complete
MKYQISRGGKGTKNIKGVKKTISITLVNPMIPRGLLCDLIMELHPAWQRAAQRSKKNTTDVFKVLICKFFNS